MMNFEFIPLRMEHKSMMLEWLNRPHFLEWWGRPDEEWRLLEESLSTDDAEPFLVYQNDNPIAYIQYWPISEARGKVEPSEEIWLSTLTDGCIGVDISLADETLCGQGLGRAILGAFIEKLHQDGFEDIIIDPDIKNTRAIKCYQAAGFVRIGQYPEMDGGTLLLRWALDAQLAS